MSKDSEFRRGDIVVWVGWGDNRTGVVTDVGDNINAVSPSGADCGERRHFRHATPSERATYHRAMMEQAEDEAKRLERPERAPGQVWETADRGVLLVTDEGRSVFLGSWAPVLVGQGFDKSDVYRGTLSPAKLGELAKWLLANVTKEHQT